MINEDFSQRSKLQDVGSQQNDEVVLTGAVLFY